MYIQEIITALLANLNEINKTDPIDTGLRDRDGTPIMVGDYVFYHHRLTRKIGDDEDINDFRDDEVCGTGSRGYVYTGKTRRIRGRVTYSLRYGVSLNLNGRYQWRRWVDDKGNLRQVEVVSREKFMRLGGDVTPTTFFSE